VTTQREVLYVAASRGRESNRLYVDTMYDPDADTQHGHPAEREAGDVLRQVLEAPGADLSATETIAADWAEQHGIVRIWAEYDTIAGVAQRERYDELVTSACSAVPAELVEGLRESAAYGPLLAALREAEAFGLNVEQGLPRLINGRTLSSADDVAAVLHGRLDRWIRASSPQRRAAADRIVGLFPKLIGETDPDLARALDDRQTLIEQRARQVATTAIENRQPWAAQLGSPRRIRCGGSCGCGGWTLLRHTGSGGGSATAASWGLASPPRWTKRHSAGSPRPPSKMPCRSPATNG